MSQSEQGNPQYGPEFEVWNYLYSGLDLANREIDDYLTPKSREIVRQFGQKIADARKSFVVGKDQGGWVEIYNELLQDPWFRHAAEIHIGGEGIERARMALERFINLRPVLTSYILSKRAASYMREVVDAYLFGFDAASIALCGALVEQVLRDLVIRANLYTEAEIRHKQPSGQTLLEHANRAQLIQRSYISAKRILGQRNAIMHRNLGSPTTLESITLEMLSDLGEVLVELGED